MTTLFGLAVFPRTQSAGDLKGGEGPTSFLMAHWPENPAPSVKKPQESRLSADVLAQIQSLLAEKQSRNSNQQKIDSQLLYAMKSRQGTKVAAGVGSLMVDVGAAEDGSVTVDITARVDRALLEELEAMDVKVSNVFPQYHSLRAEVVLNQLETIAGFPQVVFIQPKQEALFSQAPTRNLNKYQLQTESRSRLPGKRTANSVSPELVQAIGSVSSEGDMSHQAFSARGTFNTDGSGVKIGVLSDGVMSLALSQASGDLGPVTVLPGQGGFGNEGTAMLEIIHDLAPGAQLYFATGGKGITAFAQNIRELRAAGCDIIVDDISYFVESPFQDGQTAAVLSTTNAGIVTQAVNDVVSSGALYFSAAANSGNKNDNTSGTWEGDFTDGGALGLVPAGVVHDFDSTSAIAQFNPITLSGGPLNLHWSDPLGQSSNDYDLFILNSTGTAVVAASTNIQNGTQDPYEQVSSVANETDNRVVIVQRGGAANRFLHLSNNRGTLGLSTEGETHGHNAASGAFGVAAVCSSCTFPAAFNSSDTVEPFNSDGPRRIFFEGDGTALKPGDFSGTGGLLLQKPDIAAADGVSISGAGGFPNPFFGTSAAAPHAAAIAALLKSASPTLSPAEIRITLTSTAVDIEEAGPDRDSGAGIIMPYPALQQIAGSGSVTGKAFLEIVSLTPTEICCDGDGLIEPGDSGSLAVVLNNTGLLAATGINASLTSSTTGVTITAASSTYPDLPASTGTGVNRAPFLVSLDSVLPPDMKINLHVIVNYSGGHHPSQIFNLEVNFGLNGSFETGDFGGWNVSTVAKGGGGSPLQAWQVSSAGAGGFSSYGIAPTSPQAGVYDAWNGFDGDGPMEFRMYRDVVLPNNGSVYFSWRDRAQWNFCCGATQPRTYDVQVRDPDTNVVLSTLYSFSTGISSGYHDTGWLTHTSELTAYAGRKIRLYFLELIPEAFTGPGQIEFDALSLSPTPGLASVQFSATDYTTAEDSGGVIVTVNRTPESSLPAAIDFYTSDGTARQRTDYQVANGTLNFAPGETSKSISVLLVDDLHVEGDESLNIILGSPVGAVTLGTQKVATLTIRDNDTTMPTSNPLDDADAQFFVRQHYIDFLNREPDPEGLAFWTNEITSCGLDQVCIRERRIRVSDAFFFEPEYQESAGFVYRLFKASFGADDDYRPAYDEFQADRSRVVGGLQLEASKAALTDVFVHRPAFLAIYPVTESAQTFVQRLNANTGNSLSAAELTAFVEGLTNGLETRAGVLRKIADNVAFIEREYNRTFVLNLYYGYLRRDPETGGFDFWLRQIDRFPRQNTAGQQALVCSFITSAEYQDRFSSVITHTNAECPQ